MGCGASTQASQPAAEPQKTAEHHEEEKPHAKPAAAEAKPAPAKAPSVKQDHPAPAKAASVKQDAPTVKIPEVPGHLPHDSQIVFVLGGPGSGKGTQCERIVKRYGYKHLSAGDLLRDEVNSGSEAGKMCSQIMKEGKLVPMSVTITLLKNAMIKSGKNRFLIDGFPRALDQAHEFENNIRKCDLVLAFDCPEDVMEQRLMARGKTSGRADDNPETIKKRFVTFIEQSKPVIEYYKTKGKCKEISAVPPPDLVFVEVKKVLDPLNKKKEEDSDEEKEEEEEEKKEEEEEKKEEEEEKKEEEEEKKEEEEEKKEEEAKEEEPAAEEPAAEEAPAEDAPASEEPAAEEPAAEEPAAEEPAAEEAPADEPAAEEPAAEEAPAEEAPAEEAPAEEAPAEEAPAEEAPAEEAPAEEAPAEEAPAEEAPAEEAPAEEAPPAE